MSSWSRQTPRFRISIISSNYLSCPSSFGTHHQFIHFPKYNCNNLKCQFRKPMSIQSNVPAANYEYMWNQTNETGRKKQIFLINEIDFLTNVLRSMMKCVSILIYCACGCRLDGHAVLAWPDCCGTSSVLSNSGKCTMLPFFGAAPPALAPLPTNISMRLRQPNYTAIRIVDLCHFLFNFPLFIPQFDNRVFLVILRLSSFR